MSQVQCFLLTPTNRYLRYLRRYSNASRCPGFQAHHYHNARRPLDVVVAEEHPTSDDHWPHVDARWPTACDLCGYVFSHDDPWQLFHEQLWVGPDGVEHTLMRAPAGAMWLADWYPESWRGPDQHTLVVMLPDRTPWIVDGPSNNTKQPWSRTGTIPRVTARPSILTPGYHGFLTDGVLRSC